MAAHAQLSPSSAARWMPCPGSVALSLDIPNTSSDFADEGTAAHELGAKCLLEGSSAQDCLGLVIPVNGKEFTVDEAMADYVGGYVQRIRDLVESLGGELLVEQHLRISGITGECHNPNTGNCCHFDQQMQAWYDDETDEVVAPEDVEHAEGTSDAVILLDDEIIIVDLKYGQGVQVYAQDNPQLRIYALAALEAYDLLGCIKRVRMIIDQPRKKHYSEEVLTVAELRKFAEKVEKAAQRVEAAVEYIGKWDEIHEKYLAPGEKQCQFCPAKRHPKFGVCPKLRDEVIDTVFAQEAATAEEFEAIDTKSTLDEMKELSAAGKYERPGDWLGIAMGKVDLVEQWCKAVRAEAESRLLAGEDVRDYKLVEGRRGARAWANPDEAEAQLKTMRLKVEQMYDFKLISPTTAEKLHKSGAIGPRQWPKVQEMIHQPDGKPSVAPVTDKRPALVIAPVADDFENVEDMGDLV